MSPRWPQRDAADAWVEAAINPLKMAHGWPTNLVENSAGADGEQRIVFSAGEKRLDQAKNRTRAGNAEGWALEPRNSRPLIGEDTAPRRFRLCRAKNTTAAYAGGGTRTPDTRIMIPLL